MRNKRNSPDVYFRVTNNRLQVDLRAPYLNRPSSWCHTAVNVEIGSNGNIVFPDGIQTAYVDASGGYSCKGYGLAKEDGGNTMRMAMSGSISDSCLVLFSEVVSYKRPSGHYEVQLAYYASY